MSLASGKLRQSIDALAVVMAGSLMTASIAHAAELKVLSPQVMRPALNDLIPQFERSSGIQVTVFYAIASALAKKIEDGKMADLVILSPKQIERLQQKDKIGEDSLTPLAKLEVGVIIGKGAPNPDIAPVPALKKTLMSTKSIASGDPGSSASGKSFPSLIE